MVRVMLKAHEERAVRSGSSTGLEKQAPFPCRTSSTGSACSRGSQGATHTVNPSRQPWGRAGAPSAGTAGQGLWSPVLRQAGTTITTRLSVYFGAHILPQSTTSALFILTGLCCFVFWGITHFKKPLWLVVSECPFQSRHIFLMRQLKSESFLLLCW